MGYRSSHSEADLFGIIFGLGFFALIIIFSIIESKREQKRRNEIKDYCDRNNLYYSELAQFIPSKVKNFSLIEYRGHTNRYEVEMSGKRGQYNFTMFEHFSESGSGKSRSVVINTICVITNTHIRFPKFFMRDENVILDSLGKLFGGQDINFAEDPEFSKMFVLQSIVESSVRNFFDSKIRRAFVNYHVKGYKYEACGNSFMVCLPGKRLKVPERLSFLADSMRILREIVPREDEQEEQLGNVY